MSDDLRFSARITEVERVMVQPEQGRISTLLSRSCPCEPSIGVVLKMRTLE